MFTLESVTHTHIPTNTLVGAAPQPDPSTRYLGIDFHKRYSVFAVVDHAGGRIAHGRIEGNARAAFRELIAAYGPRPRVVLEAGMNVHRV